MCNANIKSVDRQKSSEKVCQKSPQLQSPEDVSWVTSVFSPGYVNGLIFSVCGRTVCHLPCPSYLSYSTSLTHVFCLKNIWGSLSLAFTPMTNQDSATSGVVGSPAISKATQLYSFPSRLFSKRMRISPLSTTLHQHFSSWPYRTAVSSFEISNFTNYTWASGHVTQLRAEIRLLSLLSLLFCPFTASPTLLPRDSCTNTLSISVKT